MSAAPPVHTATSRALLSWIDERITALDVDEMHTADRGALAAFRSVRQELVDRLPYVESDAICLITPGVSHPSAEQVMALYDTGGDAQTEAA